MEQHEDGGLHVLDNSINITIVLALHQCIVLNMRIYFNSAWHGIWIFDFGLIRGVGDFIITVSVIEMKHR